MDNLKNETYYATKIAKDFQFIVDITKGLSDKDIENNDILLDSIMFRLIQISENSVKLSDKFKDSTNSIPWFAIKGLRNRIVHDYGNVDYSVIFKTVKNDIPDCLLELNKIIN